MSEYYTIMWENGLVRMLDQRLLPQEVVYREYTKYQDVAMAIREMVIRGAPAIGAAAGYGLALAAIHSHAKNGLDLLDELEHVAQILKTARPTAVNLTWAIERVMARLLDQDWDDVKLIQEVVVNEALTIAEEDIATNRQMGIYGVGLIPDHARIIHHCNTGALATVGFGTALGVIRLAHEYGKKIHVYVDETRPRLQGARLTSWELKQLGIPHTVIVDGASGHIMRTVGIDLCLVGCDRIAANGDIANKIGTYNLALAAHAHGIPFYSVGPTSTIDLSISNGDQIPIEDRPPYEVTHIGETQITPDGVVIANPAFDITPCRYITGIVTERGVAYPPYQQTLAGLMAG